MKKSLLNPFCNSDGFDSSKTISFLSKKLLFFGELKKKSKININVYCFLPRPAACSIHGSFIAFSGREEKKKFE